jgi:hypothetical protein
MVAMVFRLGQKKSPAAVPIKRKRRPRPKSIICHVSIRRQEEDDMKKMTGRR